MARNILVVFLVVITACIVQIHANPPTKPGTVVTIPPVQTCPVPNEHTLKCMREWACQYLIRLDLRCLLNLNGNPLLGGLLGGTGGGATAGGGGGGGGGLLGGGLLGGLLGR